MPILKRFPPHFFSLYNVLKHQRLASALCITTLPSIIKRDADSRSLQHIYHEAFEYTPVKPLEDLMHPAPAPNATNSTTSDDPHPNHPEPALRTLPMSSIKVYLNGKLIGAPFTDLLSFLPPASKPLSQPGSRQGLDDGTLGYYPAISVYRVSPWSPTFPF